MRGTFFAVDLRGFAERHHDKHRFERIDIYARFLLGHALREYDFPVPKLTSAEVAQAEQTLSVAKRPVALLVPKSATTHTRTIPQRQVERLVNFLTNRGISVGLIHNEQLAGWPCSLNLTGQLNIRQLAAIIEAADVVITPDTGPMHIAEAVHTPHVDLFSAWPPYLRVSYYKYAYPIWKGAGLRCAPCYSALGPCPHLTCFARITDEEIYGQVDKALSTVSSNQRGG
jgi:ADP-heptose:LPS heptosyltransferase